MRIKIIGDNNCARATRHLLRMAGFAVTEFLPVDAITQAPHFGFAITIEVSFSERAPSSARTRVPASGFTPDSAFVPDSGTSADESANAPDSGTSAGEPASMPEHSTHGQPAPGNGEASVQALATADISAEASAEADASSPAFAPCSGASAGKPAFGADTRGTGVGLAGCKLDSHQQTKGKQAEACSTDAARIRFDSVDGALEAAVLRHVTQLASAPVVVDRPGGVVHSERELRIVILRTGDEKTDEAAAVAVEFGVLRGLLDLTTPDAPSKSGKSILFPHKDLGKHVSSSHKEAGGGVFGFLRWRECSYLARGCCARFR